MFLFHVLNIDWIKYFKEILILLRDRYLQHLRSVQKRHVHSFEYQNKCWTGITVLLSLLQLDRYETGKKGCSTDVCKLQPEAYCLNVLLVAKFLVYLTKLPISK